MARTKRDVSEKQKERAEAYSSDSSISTAVTSKRAHHRADYLDRLSEQLADLDDALQDQQKKSGSNDPKLRLVDASAFEHIPRRGEHSSHWTEWRM